MDQYQLGNMEFRLHEKFQFVLTNADPSQRSKCSQKRPPFAMNFASHLLWPYWQFFLFGMGIFHAGLNRYAYAGLSVGWSMVSTIWKIHIPGKAQHQFPLVIFAKPKEAGNRFPGNGASPWMKWIGWKWQDSQLGEVSRRFHKNQSF